MPTQRESLLMPNHLKYNICISIWHTQSYYNDNYGLKLVISSYFEQNLRSVFSAGAYIFFKIFFWVGIIILINWFCVAYQFVFHLNWRWIMRECHSMTYTKTQWSMQRLWSEQIFTEPSCWPNPFYHCFVARHLKAEYLTLAPDLAH